MDTNTDRINTAGNTGLAKVAVQCSADTFVVNQSLVLRINISGENRHLRQARKRWWQFYQNDEKKSKTSLKTNYHYEKNLFTIFSSYYF